MGEGNSRGAGPPHVPNGRAAGLRILLVEDDILIRMVTADILSGLGHAIIEASDAAEALAAIEREPVDLLLTDVGLPGRSGTELAEEVARRWPAIAIAFASGYELKDIVAPEVLRRAQVLRKPYNAADLAAALAALGG